MKKAREPGYLLLEDGRSFDGRLYGFHSIEVKNTGEVVFNTAMSGYYENANVLSGASPS